MSNRLQRALFAALVFIALASAATPRAVAAGSGYAKRPDVREFVHDFSAESGIPKGVLLKMFAQVETQESVLRLMTQPYATPPKWYDYYPQFLSAARVDAGVAFWNANRAALARAETQYGVPPEIVVAIIGVETFYGRIAGRYRVIDALTTLAVMSGSEFQRSMRPSPSSSFAHCAMLVGMNWPQPIAPAYEPLSSSIGYARC